MFFLGGLTHFDMLKMYHFDMLKMYHSNPKPVIRVTTRPPS